MAQVKGWLRGLYISCPSPLLSAYPRFPSLHPPQSIHACPVTNDSGIQCSDSTCGSIRRDRISNHRGRWPKLLQRKKLSQQSTQVQQVVESLPASFLFFILLITVVQIFVFISWLSSMVSLLSASVPLKRSSSLSESSGNIMKTITRSAN